jgi:fructokinase
MMHRIGIDLGGTKIEGILLDQNNETIDRKRVPTHREDGYKAIISRYQYWDMSCWKNLLELNV